MLEKIEESYLRSNFNTREFNTRETYVFQNVFSFIAFSPAVVWRWQTHFWAGILILHLSVTFPDLNFRS